MTPQFGSSNQQLTFTLTRYTAGEEIKQVTKTVAGARRLRHFKYIVKEADLSDFLTFLSTNAGKEVVLADETSNEFLGYIVTSDIVFKQIAISPCPVYETEFDFETSPV